MSSSQEPADPTSRSATEVKSAPEACAGGCGFYGRPESKGYCSVCYQKFVPEEARVAATASSEESKEDATASSAAAATEATTESPADSRPVQTKKHRCWQCSKKIKPAGRFSCKCGYIFCGKHRYADAHSCDFDHRKEYSAKLAKSNPEVAPSKLDRI